MRYALETNYKAALVAAEEKLDREMLSRYMIAYVVERSCTMTATSMDTTDQRICSKWTKTYLCD